MEALKILFITTGNPKCQGDYLEMTFLHGFRELLGDNFIDYPRKKIMYHDFSQTKKEELHGQGFSLLHKPLQDISPDVRKDTLNQTYDAVIYGDGHMYGEHVNIKEINDLANGNAWFIDGHDLYGEAPRKIFYGQEYIIGTQFLKCFKRELVEEGLKEVYQTGFGIPKGKMYFLDLKINNKAIPDTTPPEAKFELPQPRQYKFSNEDEYYQDLRSSWFGLTCKKGGWDCLRHYEIIAAGTLLLFRDYDRKPRLCSPQKLPCYSYSSKEELLDLMNRLVVDGKPTEEYLYMLRNQRMWLVENGTTLARAKAALKIIKDNL